MGIHSLICPTINDDVPTSIGNELTKQVAESVGNANEAMGAGCHDAGERAQSDDETDSSNLPYATSNQKVGIAG
jgi:hypothetical protein